MIDHVLPRVPYRQWVLSVPKRVRWYLREKSEVISGVLGVFLRAVETTIRQRSPGAPPDARFGAVAFVHRFGSYLNSHVHFHVLVTDGVFSGDTGGGAEFHPATELDATDFQAVQSKIRKRGLRWLHRHGLERLVRYCARPPLSQERLGRFDDERLIYSLRKPTMDGRTELILTPLEFLDRLACLVTPPRIHKHRYCGVLAPNAKLRRAVTESAGPAGATLQLLEEAQRKMGLAEAETAGAVDADEPRSAVGRIAAHCWALLLARINECLPLVCLRCGELMRIIAFILDPPVIERILTHIGEPVDAPEVWPVREPPQAELEVEQVNQTVGQDAWPEMDQTAGDGGDTWE